MDKYQVLYKQWYEQVKVVRALDRAYNVKPQERIDARAVLHVMYDQKKKSLQDLHLAILSEG